MKYGYPDSWVKESINKSGKKIIKIKTPSETSWYDMSHSGGLLLLFNTDYNILIENFKIHDYYSDEYTTTIIYEEILNV